MMVTVYSQPNCPPCAATRRKLDQLDIDYVEIDVSESPSALAYAVSLGHQQTPVVVAGEQNWSGFRPDLIAKLAA